jgi:peptidoglycan/xylan/chitin deacetylase (PgdA/CDA1 family)
MMVAVRDTRRSAADVGKAVGGRIAQVLDAAFGSRAEDRFGILYYHRIADTTPGVPTPTLNVDPARFRAQLSGLRDRGFRFSTVGEVLDGIDAGAPPPRRTVIVTFDDGYEGVWQYAWPVLRELGIRATLFVASAFPDSEEPFPFDPWALAHASTVAPSAWMPLSWGRCAEMVTSGELEIGTHTHTHADFRRRPEDLRDDIRTSVRTIRERVGVTTTLFSFPFGNVRTGFASAELTAAASDAGMRCGLTTTMDLVRRGADPFTWGRFEAAGSDTPATLAAKLDGWYAWMEGGRRLFRTVAR